MKKVQKPRKPLIFYYIIAIIVILLLNSVIFPKFMKQSVKTVDYGTFLTMVDKKEVKKVQIENDSIYFTDKAEEPNYYETTTFDDPDLVNRLYDSGCSFGRVVQEEMNPLLSILLTWVLPLLIFIGVGQLLTRSLMKKMGGGGGITSMQFGKSNAKVYVESTTGIKFSDVAGEDEAKELLTEIVDFLHNPQKYQEIGASQPRSQRSPLFQGPQGL